MNLKSTIPIKFGELLKNDKPGSDQLIERIHDKINRLSCCKTCKSLVRCWFRIDKMPILPQRENCHCRIKAIKDPLPDETAQAYCEINKFIGYIFNPKYAYNGKTDLFLSHGFTITDSDYLQKEFAKQALEKYCNGEYSLQKLDEFGQRINIDIVLVVNGIERHYISGWMVRSDGTITNNTPLGDD